MNEQEMRNSEVPTFATSESLRDYIKNLVDQEHDYGTCVYAMSMAAVAAYNYVAKQLGVTGFQASAADLDIIRRNRHMDGPFLLVDGHDALFPQYDLRQKLDDFLENIKPWLKEQAIEKLAEVEAAHPEVVAHWERLAADEQ